MGRLRNRVDSLACIIVIGLIISGCTHYSSQPRRSPVPTRPPLIIAQAIAKTITQQAAGLTIRDYNPGGVYQNEVPIFNGTFNFHNSRGITRLELPDTPGVPIISTASASYLSTSYASSHLVSGGGLGPQEPSSSSSSWRKVSYRDIAKVALVNPGAARLTVLANLAFWIDELRGASSILGGKQAAVIRSGGATIPTASYKIVVDLDNAATATGGYQGQLLRWLSTFLGVTTLPIKIWIGKNGHLRQVQIFSTIKSDSPPKNGKNWEFPSTGISGSTEQTYVLTIEKFYHHTFSVSIPPAKKTVDLSKVYKQGACKSAGNSGLTAKIIAHSDQQITGRINAAGCDIGVYVPPQSSKVVIDHATIVGASDHGIFVQDSTHILIENSDIRIQSTLGALTLPDHMFIPEDKAVNLVGTSYSTVYNNTVFGNVDGGIAINNDGIIDPGAFNPGTPNGAVGNSVIGNRLVNAAGGCGIVLSSWDAGPGVGVVDNTVSDNTVINIVPGGLIIAAVSPGAYVEGNILKNNIVQNAKLPGIVVRSNAPGDTVEGNSLIANHLANDGEFTEEDLYKNAGIALIGNFTPVTDTVIKNNIISQEQIGIWTTHAVNSKITANTITVSGGGSPITTANTPQFKPSYPFT